MALDKSRSPALGEVIIINLNDFKKLKLCSKLERERKRKSIFNIVKGQNITRTHVQWGDFEKSLLFKNIFFIINFEIKSSS